MDNHLTVDVALRLFDFGTSEFIGLVEHLRTTLMVAAGEAGKDAVSTFVYASAVDQPYVQRVVDTANSCDLELSFVQLSPPPQVLETRVVAESRAQHRKIRDVRVLRDMMGRFDLYGAISDTVVAIDNCELAPETVADLIAERLGLYSARP